MLVWRLLYVFVQLLSILCVIGDVVPANESPLWRESATSVIRHVASSTKDTNGVSTTTSKDGITGNFQNYDDAHSNFRSEETTTTELFGITQNEKIILSKESNAEDSNIVESKPANIIELDFGNFVDVTTQPTKLRKRILTGGAELPKCIIVESFDSNTESMIYYPKHLKNNGEELTVSEEDNGTIAENSIVEDLKVLESTPESLKVSWKHPRGTLNVTYYIVEWYEHEVPISACFIDNETGPFAILIDELEACTKYTVKVVPYFRSTPGKEQVVSALTKIEVNRKSLNLEVTSAGPNWIEIKWHLPHKDCVALYTVGVSDGEKFADETQIHTTTFNKSELTTGRTYNFNVTIYGKNEVYGSTYIIGETTTPEPIEPEIEECEIVEPPPSEKMHYNGNSAVAMAIQDSPPAKEGEISVEDLHFTYAKPNSLAVSWKKPNGTVEVKDYIIQWSLKTEIVHSCRLSNDTFFYAITSLNPCTTYTVEVLPRLESINGSKRVVIGTTGLDVAKHVTDFKISNNSTDWLKVSWSMPSTDCVKDYLITVCDGDKCTEDNITTTTYNKTDLSPCRTYNFNLTVFAADSADTYGSTNVTGTTDFLKPGKPMSTETVSGNYTLKVRWLEPIGHTCVDHYRVTWNRNGNSKTEHTKNTAIEFKQMEACASYVLSITPVDINKGDGQQSIITSEKTAPAVTEPPVILRGPSVTEDAIKINWLIGTNETNNCVPMLVIINCNWNNTLGEGYTPKHGKEEYKIPPETRNYTMNTEVKDLSPFTTYFCKSYTINPGGRSKESEIAIAETLQAVPSAPYLFPASESNVTNTSIILRWERPRILPGILNNITLTVLWDYYYNRPSWCGNNTKTTETITGIPGTATSYFYKVAPFARYLIKIRAATEAGWGSASEREIYYTEPGIPGEVTDLRYIITENATDPNVLDSIIIWGTPCYRNGKEIEYYSVIGNGTRDGYKDHTFVQIVNTKDYCVNDVCSLPFNDFREEHKYTIQVGAKVTNFEELGTLSNRTFEYPAGIPPQPDANYTDLISIDPYKARRTTSTATVLLPIFPDTGGDIACYAVIVSKIGYNNETFARLKDNSMQLSASWIESKQRDFEIPYQATKFCSDAYPTYVADYGRFKAVKFVIGEDTETCPKISLNKDERSYCNGPLNPDTWYHVRMRAFTAGGYRDSILFTVKTNSELDVATVVGTVFGILFLGILATTMLLVRKCSFQAVLRRFLHSDMPGSPVPAPFTRRKFIVHCQQLADNPGKLSNEYQLLQTLSVDLQMPTNSACLQANRKKNRYTDILPYDFSRVKLEVIDNDPNTDYINASFIKGFTGDEDYIACQGPKEETTYDFWRMIDQYDVKVIVMLTQLVEKNKEKCHQYFPTIRETFTYENMAIRCSMELDYRTYTQRTLVLQKENEKRNIIHLHFKDWPDHDVPEDFDPMINFCQIMRRHMEANRGLVVIHCSAGIGRTGTLIAIDILLQHIKDNRKLDVFGTVYRLRHHRINMVQRESQYAYIYNCIRQVLKNPYFSKTYKPPSVEAVGDCNSHKKKEASDSSTNLVSSIETLKKSSLSTSVESEVPIYQNSSNSTSKSRTCYSFNGLRCAKSTSAIDTKPYMEHIGRYNTHDHLISNTVKDAFVDCSEISLDITESEGSTTSIYENMQPLSRSKSAQAFGRDEDPCVTQKLLEHDTSL